MNVKLKVLRKVLEEAIDNIDAGNSNHSDDELDDIISSLTKLNRGIKRISKREACERILHCSPSSFDNYIKLGLIPRGHKEYGFKELSWSEKDFDKATLDPLLSIAQNNPEGYISVIEQELQKLNNIKQQLIQAKQPPQQNINNAVNIWDSINNEIASMTNDQKELLAKDETYISIERELQLMIQEELINSVKDKVAASPRGKELLEKQLNNIKVKKEEIIKEANKNIEVFKRFQEAARLNPNLTYAEFVKSLN